MWETFSAQESSFSDYLNRPCCIASLKTKPVVPRKILRAPFRSPVCRDRSFLISARPAIFGDMREDHRLHALTTGHSEKWEWWISGNSEAHGRGNGDVLSAQREMFDRNCSRKTFPGRKSSATPLKNIDHVFFLSNWKERPKRRFCWGNFRSNLWVESSDVMHFFPHQVRLPENVQPSWNRFDNVK